MTIFEQKIIKIKSTDKVFFLDDDFSRIRDFRRQYFRLAGFNEDNLFIAEGVNSAKAIIATGPNFDIYFLDHDLTADHYDDLEKSALLGEGTGQEVIGLVKDHEDAKFVIHTMNPFGAAKMECMLVVDRDVSSDSVTLAPFGSFTLEREDE